MAGESGQLRIVGESRQEGRTVAETRIVDQIETIKAIGTVTLSD